MGVCLGAGNAYALQASGSLPIGPVPDDQLVVDEVFSVEVFVENTSSTTPLPGTKVASILKGTTTVTLACEDSACLVPLSGTLAVLGCVGEQAGVTCAEDAGDPNQVVITMPAGGVQLGAAAVVKLATLSLQAVAPVTSTPGGEFKMPAATMAGDITACEGADFGACNTGVTGEAGGSTRLFFPPVCGDGVVGLPGETCDTGVTGEVPNPLALECPFPNTTSGLTASDPGQGIGCDPTRWPPVANVCRTPGGDGQCTLCGDNVVQAGLETCDDGQLLSTPPAPDGRNDSECRVNCTYCGDGSLDAGEACDGMQFTQPNAGNTCRVDCTYCGDGVKQTPEEACDFNDPSDPNVVAGLCNQQCVLEVCGDGFAGNRPGETCDGADFVSPPPTGHLACRGPGPDLDGGPIPPNCTYCGDGVVNDASERCDSDGLASATPTDGLCRGDVTFPGFACTKCGDGVLQAAVGEKCDGAQFDPGFPNGGNTCRVDCTYCGDGVKQAGEACDFNDPSDPAVQAGLCNQQCQIDEVCGDGIAGNVPGETCDGADFVSPPPTGHLACRGPGAGPDGGPIPPNCTYCGDGVVNDASERCDRDGLASVTPYDGLCRGNVTFPGFACTACGDGVFQPGAGEECDESAPDGVAGNETTGCCACQLHVGHLDKKLSCTGERGTNDDDLIDQDDYPVRRLDSCVSWEGTTPADPLYYELCAINDSVVADLECTISDPKLGGTVLGPITVLAGSEECVQITDFTCGPNGTPLKINGTNTATLSCNPYCAAVTPPTPAPFMISDTDMVNLECQAPGLNVTKTCEPFEAPGGTNRDFVVTVENTGTATLINCTVEDDGTVPGMCPDGAPVGGVVTLPPMNIPQILPGDSVDVTFADQPINSDGSYACNTAWAQCEILDPNTGGCVPDPTDAALCKKTAAVPADAECKVEEAFGGCRITAGGITPEGLTDPTDVNARTKNPNTFGGQVGAPCGCIGCFDEFDHIQGQWTHQRHTRNGKLHASDYNSLVCGCDGNFENGLCNPGDREPGPTEGPEPRRAPANMACFTGVGDYERQTVAFRVNVEDRGEPGAGKNSGDLEDFYKIQIWIPGAGESAEALADAACCTNVEPDIRAADIVDGGHIVHGNIQIHPLLPNTQNGRCPVPEFFPQCLAGLDQ